MATIKVNIYRYASLSFIIPGVTPIDYHVEALVTPNGRDRLMSLLQVSASSYSSWGTLMIQTSSSDAAIDAAIEEASKL